MTADYKVLAVIPTYNEVDLLRRCVNSILCQEVPGLGVVVVNAGAPLPSDLASHVIERQVPDNCFWTACISEGVNVAKSLKSDYCLFTNADTEFIPGSITKLTDSVENTTKTIACSPAYAKFGDRTTELLYSDQTDLGLLLYGKLVKRWERPAEAPIEPFLIELTGGQGVLIPMDLFAQAEMDVENFPHYASDHDLWLQARKLGYKLLLVPQSGIINYREFNDKKQGSGSLLKSLFKRMTSEYAPESWRIMWRLRRKHQGPIIGFATTFVSFGLRWTLGLPKIIRRS